MASVSRNVVNHENSSDADSGNIVDRSCEPCIRNSLTNKATLICKVCNVLLCDRCRHPHTIHIAGKHHIVRIQDMNSVPVVVDMKGMNTCQSHGKKIKFYCHDHSRLCCTTCAISHGKCDQLDEIASVSERKVPDPSFLKQILLQSEAEADSLIADCEQSKKGLDQSIADISTELHEMRDRVMQLFDMAEKSIMNEANAVKSVEVKQLDDRHAASCKIKTNINQVLSICSALMENGAPDQKYIFWRNVQHKNETFISDITEQRKMALSFPKELSTILEKGNKDIKLNCERKNTVETSLIGLSSQPRPVTLELLVSVDLQKIGDDEKEPLLTGLDFLPDGRLVAVDNMNDKCIILNERLQRLGTPYKFKAHPFGVVCVSHDALCVTCCGGKVVHLLSVSTDNTMRLTRKIKTSSKFSSICCMSPSHMVVSTCDDPRPVRIISLDEVENDLDHVGFPSKTYKLEESLCTYVQSKNTLVLTDRFAHTVYMYDTVKGTYKAVTNDNIQEPGGACVGPGDTVLLCSGSKRSIVHLTIDGKLLSTYPVDINYPRSICVSKDGTRLAVSGSAKGEMKLHLYKISLTINYVTCKMLTMRSFVFTN